MVGWLGGRDVGHKMIGLGGLGLGCLVRLLVWIHLMKEEWRGKWKAEVLVCEV